jgi:hypothetical protein
MKVFLLETSGEIIRVGLFTSCAHYSLNKLCVQRRTNNHATKLKNLFQLSMLYYFPGCISHESPYMHGLPKLRDETWKRFEAALITRRLLHDSTW